MTSVEPFNRLVRLAARAFYDDDLPSTGGTGGQQQHAQAGMAVVVLDALTRRNGQWVREDDLAASLRLQPKPLRRVIRFLEAEMMVATDHRKEPAPPKPAASTAGEGDEKEKPKLHVKSYCCLDYAQVCDVLRYRLRRMKKKIDDELTADSRDTVQQYVCPGCGRKYSAFDALRLVTEEGFSCEHCGVELVVQAADKIAAFEEDAGGDDDDGSKAKKRRRREKLIDMQRRMDEQLEPLRAQIQRVVGLPAPEFMGLRAWQKANAVRTAAAAAAAAAADTNPCRQGTEFEVAILSPGSGADQGGGGPDGDSVFKPFPMWMMKEGMDLTEKQRGGTCGSASSKVGEKLECWDAKEEKILLNEYAEANFGRELGAKSKREDEDVEEEDEYEWEEG